MDLYSTQRLTNEFRVTEVLRAMRRECHRGTHGRHETEVDQVCVRVILASIDDNVVGLDVLVPELRVVVGIERDEQVTHVPHRLAHLFIAEPAGWAHRVHALGHDREGLAGHVPHDVVEPLGRHLVLKHQTELTRRVECTALTHDLRQARSVVEREDLDDDLLHLAELALREDRTLDLIGFRDVELAARTAALERTDDLVSFKHPDTLLARLISRRRRSHRFGDATLDAFERSAQTKQASRITDEEPIEAPGRTAEFVHQGPGVVLGCGPAPDDDTQNDQGCEEYTREHGAHEAQQVCYFSADESEDVSEDQERDPEDLPNKEDQRGERKGTHKDGKEYGD